MFKEFKEMALRGGIIAPINKERLETELGIRFRAFGTGWRYDWQSDGMLARVVRPDGKEVSFAYDALGRRIRKTYAGATTHFVWDGNVPLHEWTEMAEVSESSETEKNGTGNNNLITWLFEQGTFVPAAKLMSNGDCFSIVSDYLGTPLQAYDKKGNKVWEQELDIYGRQRKRPSAFIPFKYQGQYEDAETGLYYNRFRYYDPNAGSYISQDPIRLAGNNPTLYGHVFDTNVQIDLFGLDCSKVNKRNIQPINSQKEITVYRVFGGDARVYGHSWTPIDPRTVENYRNFAGLPSGGASGANNTADFMVIGKMNPDAIVKQRPALPLDGNEGGLPEILIDKPEVSVDIIDIIILNP